MINVEFFSEVRRHIDECKQVSYFVKYWYCTICDTVFLYTPPIRVLILPPADGPYLAHSDTSILLVLFNKVLDLFLDITLILLRTHLPNS